ncbi:hypothetical protein, partial [Pseudomonas sp. S9]|uniref:hypothetical protein n=1 Tax=Pseudomonas sp. S9 TaxID=686578 RepID=UPI0002556751
APQICRQGFILAQAEKTIATQEIKSPDLFQTAKSNRGSTAASIMSQRLKHGLAVKANHLALNEKKGWTTPGDYNYLYRSESAAEHSCCDKTIQ